MNAAATSTRVVHVVDDDDDLRESVEWMLRSVGYEVQTYVGAPEFLSSFDPAAPSCLLVDLLLPGMTGLGLCEELAASRANCVFVMISGYGDVPSAVRAMQLGAVDFLEKPCGRQRLLDAVHRALELAELRRQEATEEEDVAARLCRLSAREREVLDAMAAGLVTKEIAVRLGISRKTVDVHRLKIGSKLQIESPAQIGHVIAVDLRRRARLGRMARVSAKCEGRPGGAASNEPGA